MTNEANKDRRVAVVTGGAGAIGGAIVARLRPDHTVVVLDRTGDVVVDLGDPDDVRRASELVLDRYGRCDVFVHSAAMVAFGPFDEFGLDVWRRDSLSWRWSPCLGSLSSKLAGSRKR
jgi:NAD(P)-dependent dehydrogenase (short-subunit alcohol dehydrogenase family)